jgi:hypothetical protein
MKMSGMPKSDLERMGKLSRKYFERHFERKCLLERLDSWIREEVRG